MTTTDGAPVKVALIGCSSSKLKAAAPARELYTSALFKKSVLFAERTCDRWYVLSAKHGLVHPDQVIEPYNVRLGVRTTDWDPNPAPPIHTWYRMVNGQLDVELADAPDAHLVVLAGEVYRTFLTLSRWSSEVPMKGLGIGEQLRFLTHAVADREAVGR